MIEQREIRARSWDKESGKFFYFSNGRYYSEPGCKQCAVFRWKNYESFTGLKDKNGTDIYENDLIEIRNPRNNSWAKGSATVVFSHEYVGGWVASSDGKNSLNIGTRTDHVRVIGNIHQTEETA